MRTFQITLAVEMIVLGALLLFASAAVAMAVAGFETPPPAGDGPRRDARGRLDHATAQEELLRKREREEEQRLRYRESGRRAAGPLPHGGPAPRAEPRERPWREQHKESGERRLSPG